MPTLQIKPDAPDLLQNVADTLAKARKMVIITGAGISTNSGIPDFRSENGLYSLIQDQFDRAEANVKKDSFDDDDDADTTSFDISDRPTKRRRTSGPDHTKSPAASLPEPSLLLSTDSGPSLNRRDLIQDQIAIMAPLDSSRRLTRSQVTALRPEIPRHLTQQSMASSTSTSHDSIFSDQPPSCASSQTDSSIIVGASGRSSPCTRMDTPKMATGDLTSSSPLSSPPPVLFDPYENANSSTDSSSHDESNCSDTSETDDTQQSLDFFSSHTSSSNLRNMKGRDLFDCNIWADPLKTSVFYRFATSLRQRVREVEPTVTHRFIAQMRDAGKLARVYTQNIDEIEKKIGLTTDLKHGAGNKKRRSIKQQLLESEKEEVTESPDDANSLAAVEAAHTSQKSEDTAQPRPRPILSPDKGVECVFLHGSLHALRCFVCGKLCDWDEAGRESCTMSGEQPECPHCAGATAARQERGKRALGIGKLRPDIVLYGEEHPQSDLISPIVQHDLAAGPDLLLVLGTSLRVHGLKVMVKEFAKAVHKKGGKVVFINFTKPSESAWGDVLDYWIEWDCDAWVQDLKARKPRLWLSPDERLEQDRQRRETLAEKRRETLKKRESVNEKKRDSLGDKEQHLPEQSKPRPPPKNPVAMRNDYHCGAYVVWDIFQTLAKIGEHPFDNLGYTPPTSSLDTSPAPILSSSSNTDDRCESGVKPQTASKVQKRNRKPLPKRRVPSQVQASDSQLNPADLEPILDKPSKASSLPSGVVFDTSLFDPEPTQQSTISVPTKKPPTKTKKTRKSAPAALSSTPATLSSKVGNGRKRESVNENKTRDRHNGKDRYLKAARELVRSRKTPTPGFSAVPQQLPVTPGYLPFSSELHQPYPRPTLKPGHVEGRASVDKDDRRHSASSYPFPLRRILPLPDPSITHHSASIHRPLTVSAAGTQFSQEGPMLAPLNVNWRQSPPSKIAPMEIAPFVGPASPLGEKRASSNNPQYSYTMHHSTQPIYSDPLVGISRQGVTHKPQWHVESNDDNTPSPSDQLRNDMEAANQLWQMRGRK